MFKRRNESDEISGFLDRGTQLTGELQFSGTLRIDGTFHGSITTADVLVVGEHASIHGDIRAGEVEVHGRVSGNIEAKRRLEIYTTGRVHADLRTPQLVVHPGGTLDGQTVMEGPVETVREREIAPRGEV